VDFDMTLIRCGDGMLNEWTAENFRSADALLFLGSAGIAVRAVAPHVKAKTKDPAVVVMDELGTYAIPLLSGHIGGANELAAALARLTGALPVLTTATDLNHVFAVDTWAEKQGLIIANPERIKLVSARLLAGKTVRINSQFQIEGSPPKGVVLEDGAYDVLISYRTRGKAGALRLIPRAVTLGIGCKKGIGAEEIEAAFEMTLMKAGCHTLAVCQVCSVDLKANEPGILEFCRRRELPYRTFSAPELAAVRGDFTSSAFVKSITGIENVCERAAVLGSGGRILTKKQTGNGVAMALAIREPKLRFEEEA
jgi:cobalt-precorrin 5A hydrolase